MKSIEIRLRKWSMTTLSMVASDQPRCERMEKRADPTMMHTLGRDIKIKRYEDIMMQGI